MKGPDPQCEGRTSFHTLALRSWRRDHHDLRFTAEETKAQGLRRSPRVLAAGLEALALLTVGVSVAIVSLGFWLPSAFFLQLAGNPLGKQFGNHR